MLGNQCLWFAVVLSMKKTFWTKNSQQVLLQVLLPVHPSNFLLENADQLIYRVWPRGNGVPQVLALIDHHCSFQKNKNDSMLEAILKITNGPKP